MHKTVLTIRAYNHFRIYDQFNKVKYLHMTQQSALAGQKASSIPGCTKRSVTSRLKEFIFYPLPWSCETPTGVPCPALQSSVQEMHGSLTVDTENSYRNYQKAVAPILKTVWENWCCSSWGIENTGESLLVSRKMERHFLPGPVVIWKRIMALN